MGGFAPQSAGWFLLACSCLLIPFVMLAREKSKRLLFPGRLESNGNLLSLPFLAKHQLLQLFFALANLLPSESVTSCSLLGAFAWCGGSKSLQHRSFSSSYRMDKEILWQFKLHNDECAFSCLKDSGFHSHLRVKLTFAKVFKLHSCVFSLLWQKQELIKS